MQLDLNNPKEKIDFSIGLIVILITGIFICYYSFQTPAVSNPYGRTINNSEVVNITIEDEKYTAYTAKGEVPVAISQPVNGKRKETEILIPTVKKKASPLKKVVSKISPVNDVKIQKEEVILKETIVEKIEVPELLEAVEPVKEIKPIERPKEIQPVKEKPQVVLPKKEKAPVAEKLSREEKECIILIGAFSQSSNKTKLINTLKEEGYKTFQEPFKGLQRIGVYEKCDEAQLGKTLTNFRKRFAIDAMILKRQ